MSREDNISRESLMKFIRISSDRTINSYIEKGLLPRPIKDTDDQIFKKTAVLKILGLEKFPDEPFMTALEVAEYLEYPRHNISQYIISRKIPYYKLYNSRGSQMLLLKSEVDAAIKLNIEWNADFPNQLVVKHIKDIIIGKLFDNSLMSHLSFEEKALLDDVLIKNRSLNQLASRYNINAYRMKTKFNKVCFKVYNRIHYFIQEVGDSRKLIVENGRLNREVLELRLRLEAYGEPVAVTNALLLSSFLDQYDVSVRAKNFLNIHDILTVHQLSLFTESHINKYRNIGKKTKEELQKILKLNGLDWKKEPDKTNVKS